MTVVNLALLELDVARLLVGAVSLGEDLALASLAPANRDPLGLATNLGSGELEEHLPEPLVDGVGPATRLSVHVDAGVRDVSLHDEEAERLNLDPSALQPLDHLLGDRSPLELLQLVLLDHPGGGLQVLQLLVVRVGPESLALLGVAELPVELRPVDRSQHDLSLVVGRGLEELLALVAEVRPG